MSVFIIWTLLLFIHTNSELCLTPNNETAKCIDLWACPIMLRAVKRQEVGALEYYRSSICGGTEDIPLVCCGTYTTFAKRNDTSTMEKLPRYKLWCGLQHSDDYSPTVSDTALSEFPWIALIRHQSVHKNKNPFPLGFACLGSLISARYVLTSASCVTRTNNYYPDLVRLGEYNLLNATDCLIDSQLEECNEEVKDFAISEIISYPGYDISKDLHVIHDIAVIKLNQSVTFTDYIRPLCLPLPDFPKVSVNSEIITIKLEKLENFKVNVKPKLFRKFITNDECRSKMPNDKPYYLQEGQICAEAANNNNTEEECVGNNVGGPVMIQHRYKKSVKWYQVGVVLGDFSNCFEGGPDVYTDVSYYLEWILNKIELY